MSRVSILVAGRRAAEAGMVDTCTITRVTGQTTNGLTGHVTDTRAPIYTGACRLQQRSATGSSADVGEAHLVILPFELQLPMSVVGLAEGDDVTVTASVNDSELVGREFRIKSLAHKTEATARRVGVIEVTS